MAEKKDVIIDGERFFDRLERLQTHWSTHKSTVWGGSDAICIPLGSANGPDEMTYSKSSAIHLYLLGYEFPDSVILITRNSFHFMATAKKCSMLQRVLDNPDFAARASSIQLITREKDEGVNRENFNNLINIVRKNGRRLGCLFKGDYNGAFIAQWLEVIQQSQIEQFEIAPSVGLFFAKKDEIELDLCKRAAVLTNKIMKHGFVSEMESVLDNDSKIKHDKLASNVEAIIFDPSKIGVKVADDAVDICFSPIVQSGKYDIKVSASSNDDNLSANVIICSLGARYKGYCANISRTFMVDAPPKVEKVYATLIALYDHCLEQMIPGNELKDVLESAKTFLSKKDPSLVNHLPKNLGFAIGLEFRDGTLVLNSANSSKFEDGMIFNLSVGFSNVPLSPADREKASASYQKMETFSLLLADTVRVQAEGIPDILTKTSKEYADVSYNISDKAGDDDEEEGDDDDADVPANDAASGVRRSQRSKEEKAAAESAAVQRSQRQQELMKKKIADARRKIQAGEDVYEQPDQEEEAEAVELNTYKSSENYPKDVLPNQLKVDMEREALLVPINGQPVAFHISMIKNITMPEQDRATWMRINFYIQGSTAKDVPSNVQKLVTKHGEQAVFIKELTYKSIDSRNLTQVNMLYQELRKRIKQREQKAEQEKDLVIQVKLIKIKDQRVPRLQDVVIRPQLSGRKCVGSFEAHQNGLRFTSNKSEVLDIMYSNIKHAIYQPCDRTSMVLIHFHLKDAIMIGKKRHKDVQIYTEIVDASTNLEASRRANFDPDELDDEQRERDMRKRVNLAFKEFCQKVEKVAQHYDFSLQIDVPFRKSGFEGNPNKEMVLIQPTTHALVNLTEMPFFVLTISEIDHAHFERVTYATKAFDLSFVFKDFALPPKTITAIDIKYLDVIQDWLNVVEVTYTTGGMTMNWNAVMEQVRDSGDTFYLDVDEEGEKKPAGWSFLSAEDSEEEEEDEEQESEYSGASEESESEEEDDDDDSEFEDEDDDEEEYDDEEEEELEEKGQTWDELERDAEKDDREKRKHGKDDDDRPGKKARNAPPPPAQRRR